MKILLLYKGYCPLNELDEYYREPLEKSFGSITFNVAQLNNKGRKKLPADEMREWATLAKDTLEKYDYVLIADSDWFKTLTKNKKSETTLGMVQNSPEVNSKVFYCPSQYIYQIDKDKALNQFESVLKGISLDQQGKSTIIEPEIHSEYYPTDFNHIKLHLDRLMGEPMLFCDIEAKSLKVTEAGIYTIAFATDKHNGIAFPVDAHNRPDLIKVLLRWFFENYKGKLVFHKANYDVAVLIYTLFQNDLSDVRGQLEGLNVFFKDSRIEDTLIITYLATNSCSGNILGLKQLSQPYVGDYAVDVSDVTKVPLDKLLKYNLIDVLATAYVYETYYPIMVQEEQESLYRDFMLPTLKTNIRCQLNGAPIDLHLVQKFKEDLNQEEKQLLDFLHSTQTVKNAEWAIAEQKTIKRNSKLKKKVTTVQENLVPINFNSNQDLIILVHEVMQLPVIETTDSGLASTSKNTLRDLVNHTENQEYKDILNAIADLKDVEKISTAFVPAFEQAPYCNLGNRLLGYLNLGSTVSGRLTSSDVNMQQLPSTGSRFAKPVKKLFTSSNEFLFVGIDFNSLEARIDALTTKDPNKLKIYSEGWDSHCLNASIAFASQMPDIDPNDKESVNSIKDKYPKFRQSAKSVGFALQYGGQASTLVNKSGLSEELAKEVYANYNEAYKVSVQWKESKLKEAYKNGYITTGFGLKVRTPFLKGKPYTLDRKGLEGAEARTAGNALGQGWGVLNDRAMNAVVDQIDSLGLSLDILPILKIHDACYYLVRNDIKLVKLLNDLVVKEAHWNNHPDIYHPEVGLGGQLDIFYPDWSNPLTLPEDCSEEQLIELAQQHMEKLNNV